MNLKKLTKTQLRRVARKVGINTTSTDRKSDILKKLMAPLGHYSMNKLSQDIMSSLIGAGLDIESLSDLTATSKEYRGMLLPDLKRRQAEWFEDSNTGPRYIYLEGRTLEEDPDVDFENLHNISQLSNYVEDYNFGDLVVTSDFRDTGTYIIGKDGRLVGNPDYSNSGYLTIPYEITKYLNNAIKKYGGYPISHIDLRYDDKFILENINTNDCKVPKNWKYTLSGDVLIVKFPNGKEHGFNFEKTDACMIKLWYEGSQEPQAEIKVRFEVKDESLDRFKEKYGEENYKWLSAKPEIPVTWSISYSGSGGGSSSHYEKYYLRGPARDKLTVIDSIKEFYDGFDYVITESE